MFILYSGTAVIEKLSEIVLKHFDSPAWRANLTNAAALLWYFELGILLIGGHLVEVVGQPARREPQQNREIRKRLGSLETIEFGHGAPV